MDSYKEKYLKYKFKYAKLKNLSGGSPESTNVSDEIIFFEGYLTKSEIEEFKKDLGEYYIRISNLIIKRSVYVPRLKEYIAQMKRDTNFKDLLNKYITLVENNIDFTFAYDLTKTQYSIDEILKYKDFAPNFIPKILNFTQEQKERLNNLLNSNILPVLSYHIVNTNKSLEEESEIIEKSKTDTRGALRLAMNKK